MACHARTSPPAGPAPPNGPDGTGTQPGTDYAAYASTERAGHGHLDLMAPDIHCAGCIKRIETALNAHPAVTAARVNMSTKRVAVDWCGDLALADEIAGTVAALGFDIRPFDGDRASGAQDAARSRELLLALAVAGFAAGNVMLLSVSIWSGAPDATRAMFHWLSALIALPAVGYAGRPFFRSAWAALKVRSLNMDVPISLAVLLACAMSLYETVNLGEEAYFDAAVMLLFFLLVGRYLDHLMRTRAHSALHALLSLTAKSATVVSDDAVRTRTPIDDIEAGMVVAVAPDECLPVDGIVCGGTSDVDLSMMTGESVPRTVERGDMVHEGTMNLTGELLVQVSASGATTLLADIISMMEAAEKSKARYVRLADMAARVYAPLVHGIAALTFLGWLWASGGDWHFAAFTAVAVLIITCPCALGLAVPVVQIVASGVLFRGGVLLKDGAALERLAEIDTVVLDKTGTLTLGRPRLVSPAVIDVDQLALAAGLSRHSNHPLSRAITALAAQRNITPHNVVAVTEQPGLGLSGTYDGMQVFLGRRDWCAPAAVEDDDGRQLELCLQTGHGAPQMFRFEDELRTDAPFVVSELKRRGFPVEMLSGDRPKAVARLARKLGIAEYRAQWTPEAKAHYVASLNSSGKHVLMVGDGLNDAPALAAGHASIAPSSATDAGRTAADFVFLGDRLQPVLFAHRIACRARRLVMQNFALAAGYNLIAVPLAILGYASPLVAAIAMSVSSLIVTGNALRLRLNTPRQHPDAVATAPGGKAAGSDERSAA